MIRYRDAAQLTPPAPFVNVNLRCVATGAAAGPVPGQVDTAADRTALPSRLIETLALREDGRVFVQGFAGEVTELPTYLIEVRIHDLPPILIRALLGAAEPHVLLGRDVLNAFPILLDGPRQALEIQTEG